MPKSRVIALVLAGTGLGYILVQFLGMSLGWSQRTLGFFDLVALALFGWALVNAFMLWRSRQD